MAAEANQFSFERKHAALLRVSQLIVHTGSISFARRQEKKTRKEKKASKTEGL
jgi:hypothetical protein